MNRSQRRAFARGKGASGPAPADVAALMDEAVLAYRQGQRGQAAAICKQILTRAPEHAGALNLSGILHQAADNHRLAVKMLEKALALNDLDAACHYNIATSYQALGQPSAAATHFKKAIALGLSGRDVEQFVQQNEIIGRCVRRIIEDKPGQLGRQVGFEADDLAAIAANIFLRCALQTNIIRGVPLELFLTSLRSALLRLALTNIADSVKVNDDMVALFCALAQQCFLNEYVFAQSDEEAREASRLREVLSQKLSSGNEIAPALLAAVAAYFPLHSLPKAQSLLAAAWPGTVADLLRQQVREPLEEADDKRAIPALTPITDKVSQDVREQYEENPYPRWTLNPLAGFAGAIREQAQAGDGATAGHAQAILIAGCGTGEHPLDVAQKLPQARLLAIDLSLSSLAYARRKTREEGVTNIEYAQADILNLQGIGRTFDRIESVGVLHHLADPKAGWRVLLSLLAPTGVMRVGLYSEAARRSIVEARALVARRGYQATADGIRALRQDIIREREDPRWRLVVTTVDFYSLSGCRDIFFNVMEHRLTIPEIAAFLNEQNLSFLGFELDPETIKKFGEQHPGAQALLDLDDWHSFELANPATFRNMYVFSIRKNGQ
jgi:2-polyprenyl-3-methyl-5-hydroxy-6-metoxy-1,4-benzoquinol methylase